jgi:hypothetical protein
MNSTPAPNEMNVYVAKTMSIQIRSKAAATRPATTPK